MSDYQPPAPHTQGLPRRSHRGTVPEPLTGGTVPLRPRPLVRVRWDAVLTALAALVVGVAVGVGIGYQMAPSLPPCTDRVIETVGVCQGPLAP